MPDADAVPTTEQTQPVPDEESSTPAAAGKVNEKARCCRSWLALILLVGLAMRLIAFAWGQGYCYFASGDSFEAYSYAMDYGRGEPRALYIDQPNFNSNSKLPGPLWSAVCFLSVRFWGCREGAVITLILMNTAAIYITFLLAERTVGRGCGLLAALLMAAWPFPVYYSVFLYNPNVMPLFGGLLFLALWETVRQEHSRSIFWVALLFLAMPQFHMSGLSLLPAILSFLVIFRQRISVLWLLAGVAAGACLYIPYFQGEITHGWQNTLNMTGGRPGHWSRGLKALPVPLSLLSNWVPQWARSFREYRELGRACFGWFGLLAALNLVSGVGGLMMLGGAALELRAALARRFRNFRHAADPAAGPVFLAIMIVVPLLCSCFSAQSFHSRYVIVLLSPLLGLAAAGGVRCMQSHRSRRVFLVCLVVTVLTNAWFIPALFHYQGAQIDRSEVFYASFRNLEKVYQRLKAHAGNNRPVRVEDSTYFKTVGTDDRIRNDARLIRQYVAIRERENIVPPGSSGAPVIYDLRSSEQVDPSAASVGYVGNGIALTTQLPQE